MRKGCDALQIKDKTANNFVVLNIREYLESEDRRLGEEILKQYLSEFSYSERGIIW